MTTKNLYLRMSNGANFTGLRVFSTDTTDILTLDDFVTVDLTQIHTSITYTDANTVLTIYADGCEPKTLEMSSYTSNNKVILTVTTDFSNVSANSNTYLVKDDFNRNITDDLINIVNDKADNSAVQTALNTKVNKSGDTMTGGLTFDTDDNNRIAQSIENVSTSAERDIQFYATTANHRVGAIRGAISADGNTCYMTFGACNPNNDFPVGMVIRRTNSSISCTFPDTTCVDGQWISSTQGIITSSTSLNGSTNLTYTVQVPDDGHVYEVLLRGEVETGTTSGNFCTLSIKSNELTSDWCYITGARTRTTTSNNGYGAVIIPIKRDNNNLTVRRSTNVNGYVTGLMMLAYRRVGTNT